MQRAPTTTAWSPQAGGATADGGEVVSAQRVWFSAPAERPAEALRLHHAEFELRLLGGARRECLELSLCPSSSASSPAAAKAQLVAQLNLEFDDLPDGEQGTEPLADYERELDLSRAVAKTRLQLGYGEQTRTAFWSSRDGVLVLRVRTPPAASLACAVELTSPLRHRTTAEAGGLISMVCGSAPWSAPAAGADADRRSAVVVALQAVAEEGQVIVGVRQLRVERASTLTLVLSIRKVREETLPATLHRAQVDLHALSDHGYEGLRSRHERAYEAQYARGLLRLWPERSELPFDERRRCYRIEHEPGLLALLDGLGRHWLVCNAARLAHTDPRLAHSDERGPASHARPAPGEQDGSVLRTEQARRALDGGSSNSAALRGEPWSLCWAQRAAEVGQLQKANAACVSEVQRMTTLLLEAVDAFATRAPFRYVGEAHDTALLLASLCNSLWDHVAFSGDTHGLEPIHALVSRGTRSLLTLLDLAGLHESPPVEARTRGLLLHAHCQQLCSRALQLGFPLDSSDHEWRGLLELDLNRLDRWLADRSAWQSAGTPAGLLATRANTPSAALAPAVAWLQAQQEIGVRRHLGEAHARVLAKDGEGALELLADLVYPAPDGDDPYGVRVTDALFTPAPPVAEEALIALPFVLAEMILQSHDQHLHLLPALPEAWKRGEIRGLRARGGFEVAMTWDQGHVVHATLDSHRGCRCRIRSRTPLRLDAGSVRRVRPVQSAVGVLLEIDTYPGTSFSLVPANDSRDTLR